MTKLPPVNQKFILHWGEMGARWGINRTVAQIHALLYLSPRPLPAEEIGKTLSIARSSVSTSLRELQNWGLVNVVHELGDRRDHYEAVQDVWEIFQMIFERRKQREVDPTLTILKSCLDETGGDAHTRERLQEMLEFFDTLSTWYEQLRGMPDDKLLRFLKVGNKVRKLLGPKG